MSGGLMSGGRMSGGLKSYDRVRHLISVWRFSWHFSLHVMGVSFDYTSSSRMHLWIMVHVVCIMNTCI